MARAVREATAVEIDLPLVGYQYPNGIFPGCECDSATVELDLYVGSPKWSPPEEATSVD